jgi:hypothetical protein
MNNNQDFIGSDFPTIMGLLGLDGENAARVMAANPRLAKAMATQVAVVAKSSAKGSRAHMENRIVNLEPRLADGLVNGGKQLVDTAFYFLKSAGSKTTLDMIADDDSKVPGLCNVSRGRLDQDEPFLLAGIMLLTGVAAGTSQAEGLACDFGVIHKNLRNGEFELKANGKTLIPEMSTEVFVTHREINSLVDVDGTGTGANAATAVVMGEDAKVGLWIPDNPKLIKSNVEMKFTLNWGVALPTNTWVKLVLLGTRVATH